MLPSRPSLIGLSIRHYLLSSSTSSLLFVSISSWTASHQCFPLVSSCYFSINMPLIQLWSIKLKDIPCPIFPIRSSSIYSTLIISPRYFDPGFVKHALFALPTQPHTHRTTKFSFSSLFLHSFHLIFKLQIRYLGINLQYCKECWFVLMK